MVDNVFNEFKSATFVTSYRCKQIKVTDHLVRRYDIA
jgi:hypothetical protein